MTVIIGFTNIIVIKKIEKFSLKSKHLSVPNFFYDLDKSAKLKTQKQKIEKEKNRFLWSSYIIT